VAADGAEHQASGWTTYIARDDATTGETTLADVLGSGVMTAPAPRISPDVVFRDLDGEAVLLNLRTGVYFGLDPVGTRIWDLLVERRSLPAILDTLLGEYEVDTARCERDVRLFLAALTEHALLEADGPPPA